MNKPSFVSKLDDGKTWYFLFNVWSLNQVGSTSLGDAFLNIQELFDTIKESSTGFKVKKIDKIFSEISAQSTITLYRNGLVVGNITLGLTMNFNYKNLMSKTVLTQV